jgi:DNA-binding beta-propeller fold protein YncE
VDVFTHFGFFIFLAFAWLATSIAARLAPARGRIPRRLLVYAAAAVLLAIGFFSIDVLCVAAILLFLFALFRIAESTEERLASGLLAAAFFLVLFPQRAYVFDRMNTFFKLYFEAWPLFALSTAVLVFATGRRGVFDRWPRLLRGVFFVLLSAAMFTSVTAARGALLAPGNPSRPTTASSPSLDGLRYLEQWRPGEYRAVEWLRREIPGTPVILEAQGASYQDLSRISMLTGIPTVLGWEHHVKQRGNPEAEIAARRGHIKQIFSSPDLRGIRELLRSYHVGYVYVGWLERQTYPAEGLKKFSEAQDLFQIAYENPDVRIYRVIGGDSQDVIAPVREVLPVPVAEKAREEKSSGDEPEEPPEIREKPAVDVPPFSGMKEPRDAAVDGRGRLWIADFGNSRIKIFDPEGGFLGGWGGRGSGTFGLREPCGVAIRGEDVYIADTWNGRIQLFTISGEWKATAGQLYGPRGIAVAAEDGTVWVADTGNKRIAVYDRFLKPIRTIGKLGSGPLEFSDPVGIAVGPSGSIHVADAGNGRIQVLDAKGEFTRAIPVPKWNRNVEPHIEVGDDGTIYATDPEGNALIAMKPSGELESRRTQDDSGRPLARPTGVAIDRKNRILYVVNSGNSTISKWSLPGKRTP